jgi:hypothetical protein
MKISVPLLPPVKALCRMTQAMAEAAAALQLPLTSFQDPDGPFTLAQCVVNLPVGAIRVYAHICPGRPRGESAAGTFTQWWAKLQLLCY